MAVTRAGLMLGVRKSYTTRVQDHFPAAFWPLWESSGTSARCLINTAQNGTYNSDVSAWPVGTGIGDGNTVPYFSNNDRCNVYTTTFRDAFDGAEGTVLQWAKVGSAGVWTDGVARRGVYFAVNSSNRIILQKSTVNNQITLWYGAGGVAKQNSFALSSLACWNWAITWSKSADEVKFFRSGVQQGSTMTGLGTWAGTFDANTCNLGCTDNLLADPWIGWLGPTMVWTRALPPAEVASVSALWAGG